MATWKNQPDAPAPVVVTQRPWIVTRVGLDVHVIPALDSVKHETRDCACGPEDHKLTAGVLHLHHRLTDGEGTQPSGERPASPEGTA